MGRGALRSGDRRWRHGHDAKGKPSPTYSSWTNMMTRCTNDLHHHYADYGGRGIQVCDRWRAFANFLADMGERPIGQSLDRYPNRDGNYEPGNCRWATQSEQCRNRRSSKPVIRSDGKLYASMGDAADDVGGNHQGVWEACSGRTKTHRGFGWSYA